MDNLKIVGAKFATDINDLLPYEIELVRKYFKECENIDWDLNFDIFTEEYYAQGMSIVQWRWNDKILIHIYGFFDDYGCIFLDGQIIVQTDDYQANTFREGCPEDLKESLSSSFPDMERLKSKIWIKSLPSKFGIILSI